MALHEGRPLIGHVAQALQRQCAAVVVCGREWNGLPDLSDPIPGLGPMGGLSAALQHAAGEGFDAVLAAPCDLLGIPEDAVSRLSPAPAVADGMWLLGLWPAQLADLLSASLSKEGAISARRWIALSHARVVSLPAMRNINRPDTLAGP